MNGLRVMSAYRRLDHWGLGLDDNVTVGWNNDGASALRAVHFPASTRLVYNENTGTRRTSKRNITHNPCPRAYSLYASTSISS